MLRTKSGTTGPKSWFMRLFAAWVAALVTQCSVPALLPVPRIAAAQEHAEFKGIPIHIYPHDDLRNDSSFNTYRRKLRLIVDERNARALYHSLSADFFIFNADSAKVLPDNGRSPEELFRSVFPADVIGAPAWKVLNDVITAGVRKSALNPDLGYCGPAFDRPTASLNDPDGRSQWSAHVVGYDVPLRDSAGPCARQIGTLSWDVVKLVQSDGSGAWSLVKTPDGKSGWMESRLLLPMSPTCGRSEEVICFTRTPGQDWKVSAAVVTNPCE